MSKKKPAREPFTQLPDPEWAADLVEGRHEKAQELGQKIDELGDLFGAEAADDCRSEMKRIAGKAMLRKVERDNPHWDGKTRIVP